MNLIVLNDDEGKPLRARVRISAGEIDKLQSMAVAEDLEGDEVVDLPLDPASEYQLVLAIMGKVESWKNSASMTELETLANSQ